MVAMVNMPPCCAPSWTSPHLPLKCSLLFFLFCHPDSPSCSSVFFTIFPPSSFPLHLPIILFFPHFNFSLPSPVFLPSLPHLPFTPQWPPHRPQTSLSTARHGTHRRPSLHYGTNTNTYDRTADSEHHATLLTNTDVLWVVWYNCSLCCAAGPAVLTLGPWRRRYPNTCLHVFTTTNTHECQEEFPEKLNCI